MIMDVKIREIKPRRYSVIADGQEIGQGATRLILDMEPGSVPELMLSYPVYGKLDVKLPYTKVTAKPSKEKEGQASEES